MNEVETIRANAQLIIDKLGPLSGMGDQFGYNRESVAWVEGYIERQRERNKASGEESHKLAQVFGSWLGECVIHVYGGEWRQDSGTLGVFFDDKNAVFPFYSVAKQFKTGLPEGDSILGAFDMIGLVILNKSQE